MEEKSHSGPKKKKPVAASWVLCVQASASKPAKLKGEHGRQGDWKVNKGPDHGETHKSETELWMYSKCDEKAWVY